MLVQAAWAWYRRDPHARQIYNRLLHNTGNGKKAIVGLAKRIAIHLWRMLCDGCFSFSRPVLGEDEKKKKQLDRLFIVR
jgi:hypothetical protein